MTQLRDNLLYLAAQSAFADHTLHFHNVDKQREVKRRLMWMGKLNLQIARKIRDTDKVTYENNLRVAREIRNMIITVNYRIGDLS